LELGQTKAVYQKSMHFAPFTTINVSSETNKQTNLAIFTNVTQTFKIKALFFLSPVSTAVKTIFKPVS